MVLLMQAAQRTLSAQRPGPVLHHTVTNNHRSAISGITPDGRLYPGAQEQVFCSDGVMHFLKHLLYHTVASCRSSGMARPSIAVR